MTLQYYPYFSCPLRSSWLVGGVPSLGSAELREQARTPLIALLWLHQQAIHLRLLRIAQTLRRDKSLHRLAYLPALADSGHEPDDHARRSPRWERLALDPHAPPRQGDARVGSGPSGEHAQPDGYLPARNLRVQPVQRG